MIKGVLIATLIVLIGIVLYLGYFVMINFYSTPLSFRVSYNETELKTINSSVEQFYPNMRFKSSKISYSLGEECDEEKRENMVLAFDYLSNRTGVLKFNQQSTGDIEVRCGEEYEKEGLFVAGEGGPVLIINGSLFNVILDGQILLLYSEPPCRKEDYNVNLHELLHVFGFGHSSNPKSILYNISSCNQGLGDDIVEKLIQIYSIESLPDLYFSEINAVKKGNYLNFNFTVRNQGLETAENVSIELFTESGMEDSSNFESIEVGAGRVRYVENLRVPLKTKNIKLVIMNGRELDDTNNVALLSLE